MKPFVSEKMTPIDNDKIVKNDDDTAKFLNNFFSNIVRDLKIPDYNNCDPLAENIQEPVLKAIVKYGSHPSILTMGEGCRKSRQFSFRCADNFKFRCAKRLSSFRYPIKNC